MSEQGGMTTLIGREETHGRRFPTMMERLVFLISIVGAVFLGQWMYLFSDVRLSSLCAFHNLFLNYL